MGPIGMQEMIALFVIALLLFGPKKLPELGRTLGKALSEFRRAKNELKSTFESHMHELERETRLDTPSTYTPSSSYSYPYDDYGQQDTGYGVAAAPETQETSADAAKQLTSSASGETPHTPPADQPVAVHSPSPVAGTVPRTNGARPLVHSTEEDHQG